MKTELSEYDKQAETFLSKHGLKFRATLSDTKTPAWKEAGERCGHHYRVTLSQDRKATGIDRPARKLVFDYWGSIRDAETRREPSAYDVLACISGDVYYPESFEDFCAEYGYNEDSIKALQTFRRCSAFAKRLQAFFTEAEIEELQQIQ